MFTAEGFATNGAYNSTSVSGYTTSGITKSGQFCLTDILNSTNQVQVPICAITTVNSATSVTNSYWNIQGYNYSGGVLGFGPQNTKFW
jgi:hypothetical protein